MHNKIRTTLAILTASLIASIVGLFGVASPALAARLDCPNSYLCIWDGVDYTGTRWQYSPGTILTLPGDCQQLSGTSANNKASSIYLRATLVNATMTLWPQDGRTDTRGITSGQYDPNMLTGSPISNFSNVLSAICMNPN